MGLMKNFCGVKTMHAMEEQFNEKGKNIYIDSLSYDEFMLLGDLELSRRFSELEEESEKEKLNRSQDNELEYSQEPAEEVGTVNTDKKRKESDWEDTLTNRMLHWDYSEEQKEELRKAIAKKIAKDVIMQYFYPDVSVETMKGKFVTNR